MARLKDRIGSSGYFDAAGRTAARTGLKVPETGFFGREFDVQDLGRLARGAQSTYDVVQDVFDTGIKPVVQKLDQLSKEAGVKRAKKTDKSPGCRAFKAKRKHTRRADRGRRAIRSRAGGCRETHYSSS